MFSWFLKLLGINEDRPASSGNTFLDTSKKIESEQSATETTIETPQQPEPEKSPEPEAVIKPEVEPEAEQAEKPEPKPTPEPEPEQKKSLADQLPGLKANHIKALNNAGFTSKGQLDMASDKELLALKGIGPACIKVIRS